MKLWPFFRATPTNCGRELAAHRHLSDRERVKARARQMNVDMGRPIPEALW